MGRFPDTTVKSPWDGPKPVLHLSHGGGAEPQYNRQLKAQIKNPHNTHVIREVRAGYFADYFTTPRPATRIGNYSYGFLEAMIGRAEEQYTLLEKDYGVQIPEHEFAIVEDNIGRKHALARIAIIDGQNCGPRHIWEVPGLAPRPIRSQLNDALHQYHYDVDRFTGLADVHPKDGLNDFVYGIPRVFAEDETAARQAYLVDLEPLFIRPATK